MSKLNLTDLASRLMEKHGLDKREAAFFIDAIIETIHKGLDADKQVKIKGLGTFKIVGVGARESVNVNTGERVVIDSHSKISFTPDAAMKELVNKPFSQFETVALNDGVEFDDMPQEETVGETESEPVVETEPVVEPEPEPVVEPEPEPVVEPEPEPVVVPEPEPVVVPEPEPVVAAPLTSAPEKQPFPWLWILVAAIGGFLLGYLFAKATATTEPDEPQKAEQVADTAAVAQPTADTAVAAPVVAEPAEVASEPEAVQAEEPAVTEPVAPATAAAPVFDSQKYEDMDARVRLGAYRIIGVQETVKARAGESLKQISRRYLGPDMECYVEALNGLKSSQPLTPGQEIKIPKLEWKKNLRKK